MVVSVKVLVDCGVLEAKVGAEIDHLAANLKERNREFSRNAMRESQKDDLRLFGEQFGFWFAETKFFCPSVVGKFRKDLSEALSGILSRRDGGQFHIRMRK